MLLIWGVCLIKLMLFNHSLNNWDVSSVTDMGWMFNQAYVFNQDIGDWDTRSVTNMKKMFEGAYAFNQNIGDWDVSSVTNMNGMFNWAYAFNQDIGDWDVGNVNLMGSMFKSATNFNQNLSRWRVCQVTSNIVFDTNTNNTWTADEKPRWGAPCVRAVSSVDGTYAVGDGVDVVVEFNKDVNVTGIPTLDLGLGSGNKSAVYVSGSGTGNLTFRYVVRFGDVAADLDYVNVSSLRLAGGTIKAADDNKTAVLTLPSRETLAANGDVVVDGNSFGAGVFTATWNTSATTSGSSNSTSLSLPLESSGDYDFVVYWGDGNSSVVTAGDSVNKTHDYGTSGVYVVNVVGRLEGFRFNYGGDREKLINITSWSGLNLGNGGSYFYGATNFVNITADDVNLSGTTDFSNMFAGANKFNGDVSGWDVSGVTNMSNMFSDNYVFNQDIGDWDVSGVTDMNYTFYGASAFNQDISGWDVGSVKSMESMFNIATAFNGDLRDWRVCQVANYVDFDRGKSGWNTQPKWSAPCVVDFSVESKTYKKGEIINIRIDFNENVSVNGTATLEMKFEDGNKNFSYSSGNGTENLTFSYSVVEGDDVGDLDWSGVGAMVGDITAVDDGGVAVLTIPTGKRGLAGRFEVVVDWDYGDGSSGSGGGNDGNNGGSTTTGGSGGGGGGSSSSGSSSGGGGGGGGSGSGGSGEVLAGVRNKWDGCEEWDGCYEG